MKILQRHREALVKSHRHQRGLEARNLDVNTINRISPPRHEELAKVDVLASALLGPHRPDNFLRRVGHGIAADDRQAGVSEGLLASLDIVAFEPDNQWKLEASLA